MNRNCDYSGEYSPRNQYEKCYEQRCPEFEINCPYAKNNWRDGCGCNQQKSRGCEERRKKQCCDLCECVEDFFRCIFC